MPQLREPAIATSDHLERSPGDFLRLSFGEYAGQRKLAKVQEDDSALNWSTDGMTGPRDTSYLVYWSETL